MHQKRHVFEFMTRDVYTAAPETSLKEITTHLVERRATAAPILDQQGLLLGLVALADIAVDALTHPDSAQRQAQHVMQRRVFTVGQEADLSTAVEHLRKHRVHRLVVTEGDRVVGVLSCLDVLDALTEVFGYSPFL
jgi:predicted transcriptional regulator